MSATSFSPSASVILPFPTAAVRQSVRPSTVGVLHLINGEHFSGAERVQQLLGERLPDFYTDPHFVCLKPDKFPKMAGLPETNVHTLGMRSRADLAIIRKVADLALGVQAHVLHAHTPRTAMIASLVARRTRLPWVFHVHSPTARDSTRWGLNRINDIIERWSLRSCNHIVTVSKSLRREMLSRGVSRTRVTCIPNGVAVQTPIVPEDRLSQETWRLGMVALIRPRKGIEVLLEAMAKVLPQNNRVTLDVVGPFETNEYEQEVLALVRKLGLQSSVNFLGFRKDMPDVMRQLDAMVLPSLFGEGMPMVVLEALAVGVPVIATRVEGTPEVMRDGREGYLAAPRDPESLADAIMNFTSDRQKWCELSHNAVQRQQDKFSDVQMASKLAKLYHELSGV